MNLANINLINFLYVIPSVLIALTFHEYAHGWVAYKLGDPTAKNFGRLTLNPLKHLDIIGTICMILFHFGWAKPVPINSRYFSKPRRDIALTAAAGPIMNLILGFIGSFVYVLMLILTPLLFKSEGAGLNIWDSGIYLVQTFFSINISLCIFNLIPVPPLDGSKIIYLILPPKWAFFLSNNERYIRIALLVLLWSGIITLPLTYLSTLISSVFLKLWLAVLKLFLPI